jgi:hypothetical protein
MRAKVTKDGLIIPKKMLKGVTEVEIHKKNGVVLVVPKTKNDSIYRLGSNPVTCGTPHASERLDDYLYVVNQ